eukprot:CAMPEP_0185849676 /NCGR_PEP_ID=MMETSP1354-20130828/4105_1 /TAXON_ID=708628 /ORGANISM="Erythrolobus madagascarensis, Strain CCMP3276" /LENGTH=227 /DNA_ID=CAMNT_0028550253 /DNA_START=160 /DNA_END=843 /DNA_ORIENTATION=+
MVAAARRDRRTRYTVPRVVASAAASVEIAPRSDAPDGAQEFVIAGELKNDAFLRLFTALEDSIDGTPIRAVLRTDFDASTLEARFDLDNGIQFDAVSKCLQDTYATLPAFERTPVKRTLVEYENGVIPSHEVLDYDAGYTVFVDNSASSVVTTISLGCFHKNGYCVAIRDVLESEGVQLVFASMRLDADSNVRNDSMHVLNSNGDRLDEPSRRRLLAKLYQAIKALD